MTELIDYLANILNIKTNSDLVILDMQNELQSITDIAHYRAFIRSNLNYLGMEYKTGFQKFIMLTEIYKKQYQVDANRLASSSSFAKQLAEKVRSVSSYVLENSDLECTNFVNDDGCIFTDFEQLHLGKVGSLLQCVRIQRSVSGEDELLSKLNASMQQIVINEAIGHKPQKKTAKSVAGLIGGAVKGVRA